MQDARRWQQVIHLGEQLLSIANTLPGGQTSIPRAIVAQRELVLQAASALFGGSASLWLSNQVLPGFIRKSSDRAHLYAGLFSPRPPEGLKLRAWQSGQIETAAVDGPVDQSKSKIQQLAAPLLMPQPGQEGSFVLGVLQVDRPEGPAFTAEDGALLIGLAGQAMIAIQAERKVLVERWRVEQLDLVWQVSAQIAAVRDLNELARQVTQLILSTFNYYYTAIFTLEAGEDVLHFRASAGPRPRSGAPATPAPFSDQAVHLGQGMIGHVAQTGEEVLANDVSQEDLFRFNQALPGTLSEATLPLKVEGRVVGVLDVQSEFPNDFYETDILVLRALAGNIAVAVEGARLYSNLRGRAEQLSTLSEVSNAIASILDQEKLLDEVAALIHNRFGYPYVHLFSVHPGRRKVFYEAGSGPLSDARRQQRFSLDLDDPQGLVPWVARNAETILANDVESEPRYRETSLPPDLTRAELTVPLMFGGEVLGILDVQSDRLNAFSQEDRFLFEALADTVAVALRNATLYRSERWRRQVADSLREVAGLLSADVDLDHVLDAILVELMRNLPCNLAAIWLRQEGDKNELPEGQPPRLQLAAVAGEHASELDLEIGLTLEEVLELHEVLHLDDPEGVNASWLAEALASSEPLVRTAQSPYDPLGAALDYPADYSAIAAPLQVNGQPLGLLTLIHSTPDRYGGESRVMTATFASYAAVAIENARLYEAAHEQAWVSTVLLQVSEATQALDELDDLLETITNLAPTLVGVRACGLYLLDEDGYFTPAAASGLDDDQLEEFQEERFAPGDVPVLDRLAEDRQPIVLHDDAKDYRLVDIFSANLGEGSLFESELLVLVPMVSHEALLGAFLVNYSDLGREPDSAAAEMDERLAIIQGLVHQTAIAVENIRLQKSQREEAYVSVALLQVAQAIVSMTELDDILGAIVRLTPILVGIKRAAIYIWTGSQGIFRQAQTYGLPRSSGVGYFRPDEFPLLQAVREADRLVAVPFRSQPEASFDVRLDWAALPVPAAGESASILESDDCLLLAFPLSVKGSVVGVFVVEEPDQPAAGPGHNANHRLRPKRLEIITGISQQTAMAIQNDQLQREMLERERLEREMQLARDIQRAFLPHQLPELPGWDLSAWWRTAREVGGDFYDFIDLPEGRLGLVIADVADKGMPAALFMTLIRTLMRATAVEIESPAEVLDHVNTALVPDARDGMFVTLFYGVLHPKTGRLVYANAGHNPPLVAQASRKHITRLARTGMALGVEAGSPIHDAEVRLRASDFLVLYTDGVTEAFDLEGEEFGESGLLSAIRAALGNCQDASQMLDAISQAVTQFTSGLAPADDLTLVVAQRQKKSH